MAYMVTYRRLGQWYAETMATLEEQQREVELLLSENGYDVIVDTVMCYGPGSDRVEGTS